MQLLKELSESYGAPGFEDEVRAVVLREVKKLADSVKVDPLGNVIVLKKATLKGKQPAKKVMLAGHMDEIGFVVSHVNKDGFLRLTPLGGFDPKTLIAKRVMVHGKKKKFLGMIGTKPIHVMNAEDRAKMPQMTEIF
ncbi:M42 family peptidase, partial [Candidatus Woesearchaeota archaeon]|nr:M42 family peptidase [Candidatus Woesearchaeota archaeon]